MPPDSTTAVVIVDMLVDYFDPSLWPKSELPSARERLAASINRLTRDARSTGAPVIWIRQEFKEDLSDAFPHMRRDGRRYTIRGTPGCELIPELEITPDDHEVFKKRFSAFFETDLDRMLREFGITTVVLAGITTAWCIRSTATDAYQLGYDVRVVADCVAGFTSESHLVSLEEMDGYVVSVVPVEGWNEGMRE